MLSQIPTPEIPLSSIFIDFLSRFLDGKSFSNERWSDQISEDLICDGPTIRAKARTRLNRLLLDERAQKAVENAFQWFNSLALGVHQPLGDLHERFQFICIVGLARTGGSYLTAELFSALGLDPMAVPASIAHDGFPDVQPVCDLQSRNHSITSLMNTCEFLEMLNLYYPTDASRQTIVPKKLTKAVYAGGLFKTILGPTAEYVVTIRNPLASCISTYEKSGGFPTDGRTRLRSNIERWIKRDLLLTGLAEVEFAQMNYFEAYVRYWEQYYINLAMCGLFSTRNSTVVAFGKEAMECRSNHWQRRFASKRSASPFLAPHQLECRHPEWHRRADDAIHRVASVWSLVGLDFPVGLISNPV